MSKNRVYFPIDEQLNLFSMAISKEGIVIPLENFGYHNIHLTIYIKEMNTKQGYKKLSIHLTNNLTKEKIKECFLEFNDEHVEQYYHQKFIMFLERYTSSMKKYAIEKEQLINLKLGCYDCFLKEKKYVLYTKQKARDSYSQMIKNIIEIPSLQFDVCTDIDHIRLVNLDNGEIYLKAIIGIIKLSDQEMFKEFIQIIETVFYEEKQWIEKQIKEFEQVLMGCQSV